MKRGFEPVIESQRKIGSNFILPIRGTKTSAGYDFFATCDLIISPQDKVFFWTDVKAKMKKGEVLLLDIRSSIGIKKDLMLSNTIGVIDSDYYSNGDNDGNIGICIRNLKPSLRCNKVKRYKVNDQLTLDIPIVESLIEENTVIINAGERVAQGFFVEYKEAENCNSDLERTGGIGSTK